MNRRQVLKAAMIGTVVATVPLLVMAKAKRDTVTYRRYQPVGEWTDSKKIKFILKHYPIAPGSYHITEHGSLAQIVGFTGGGSAIMNTLCAQKLAELRTNIAGGQYSNDQVEAFWRITNPNWVGTVEKT